MHASDMFCWRSHISQSWLSYAHVGELQQMRKSTHSVEEKQTCCSMQGELEHTHSAQCTQVSYGMQGTKRINHPSQSLQDPESQNLVQHHTLSWPVQIFQASIKLRRPTNLVADASPEANRFRSFTAPWNHIAWNKHPYLPVEWIPQNSLLSQQCWRLTLS